MFAVTPNFRRRRSFCCGLLSDSIVGRLVMITSFRSTQLSDPPIAVSTRASFSANSRTSPNFCGGCNLSSFDRRCMYSFHQLFQTTFLLYLSILVREHALTKVFQIKNDSSQVL
ncbi:unnamed protein product, partial [Dicrocoelium dendriticum]